MDLTKTKDTFDLECSERDCLSLRKDNPTQPWMEAVFRIRINLNADSDPGFYLKADPDPDSGSWSKAFFAQKLKSKEI